MQRTAKSTKIISVIAAIALVLAFIPVQAFMSANKAFAAGTYKVGADNRSQWASANDGVFTYKVDGQEAGTMTIAGAGLAGSATINKEVASGTKITVTLHVNEGYQVELLYAEGNERPSLTDVSATEKSFVVNSLDNDYVFEASFKKQGADPEPQPEPTPKVTVGHFEISRVAGAELDYSINGGPWKGMAQNSVDMNISGASKIAVRVNPSDRCTLSKEGTTLVKGDNEGSGYQNIDLDALLTDDGFVVDLDGAHFGYIMSVTKLETRNVTLSVDSASARMLANKVTMSVGYGDKNDVQFSENGKTVAVDKSTEKKIVLSFAINSEKYFIPTVDVNGKTYKTTDTGMKTEDGHVIICCELQGADAAASDFIVNLTMGAKATINKEAASINAVEAKYTMISGGKSVMSTTSDDPDVAMTVKNTATDSAVEGAVGTFDLGVTVDGTQTAETGSMIDVAMELDTSVYTASDYVVYRNHNGVVEKLDGTEYNANTGVIKFSSDKYSDYSLVPADYVPAEKKSDTTTATILAKTGDVAPIVPMAVAAIAAVVVAIVAIRRRVVE